MKRLLIVVVLLLAFLPWSAAQAVTPNSLYVESDSYHGVPVQCANHNWHYVRPGHKSKCVRTIAFHARFKQPYTAFYDDQGHWKVLKGGTYNFTKKILLRNGWTV